MKFPEIPELYSLYREFPAVITDSRKARRGTIFFSLKGDRFDGNRFAESAMEQGCSYVIIDDEKHYKEGNYVLVKDVLDALQQLAKYHRGKLKIPVIGITGSNGKTTTKELIRNVLSQKYVVLATEGNLNNHIGVPLTLLSIVPGTEIAVIEMGANHVGEIALLCRLAQPDYGIITNIGKAHVGEFGSFEAVIKAKSEMYDYIKENGGKLFINGDNELLMRISEGAEKITYGNSENFFCEVTRTVVSPCLEVQFEDTAIASHLAGKYNFENVAAAVCIGKYFGLDAAQMKKAIEGYIPSNNRSQMVRTKHNTLLMDAYNANPSSMQAALENFSEMEGTHKWLILGDMLELGNYEMQEHKNILHLIKEKGFRNVILVGDRFSRAASEFIISFPVFFVFRNSDELAEKLRSDSPIQKPSTILVKGSRGIRLEKLEEYL